MVVVVFLVVLLAVLVPGTFAFDLPTSTSLRINVGFLWLSPWVNSLRPRIYVANKARKKQTIG